MGPDFDLPVVEIDGAAGLTAETVAAVRDACDRAEDGASGGGAGSAGDENAPIGSRGVGDESRAGGVLVLRVTGTPDPTWAEGLTVALVNKWEQQLRRLENLPVLTVAVATGDCGGPALDALLATDHRIAAGPARLCLPLAGGGAWPGMAVYRLAHQGPGSADVRRAVLFGAPIDTAAALAADLIDEVADDVELALKAAGALADRVQGSELAIRRRLLAEAATTGFEEALGAHLAAVDRTLRRVAAGAAS